MDNILSSIGFGAIPGMFMGGNTPNPADSAMPYLDRIPGEGAAPLRPYQQAGEQALGRTQDIYDQLLNDPGELMKRLSSGFTESPSYQYDLAEAMRGINSAAATGGMLGTPSHQMQAGRMAGDMANRGYNDYLKNILGLYGSGLSGEQHLTDIGYGTAGNLSDLFSRNLMNQAGLAFQGQSQENQAKADQMSNLMSGIGTAASFFF